MPYDISAMTHQFDSLAVFSLDVILPSQFWDSTPLYEPEKMLMMVILEQGIRDYLGMNYIRYFKETRREAEEWIWSDDDGWTFSFVRICEGLDIDPTYLRRRWIQWKAKKSRLPAHQRKAA